MEPPVEKIRPRETKCKVAGQERHEADADASQHRLERGRARLAEFGAPEREGQAASSPDVAGARLGRQACATQAAVQGGTADAEAPADGHLGRPAVERFYDLREPLGSDRGRPAALPATTSGRRQPVAHALLGQGVLVLGEGGG